MIFNRSNFIKATCVALSAIIFASTFTACSKQAVNGGVSSSSPTVTTEPEAKLPDDKPTSALSVTFCNTPYNEELITANTHASYEVYKDRAKGNVLKLTSKSTASNSNPSLTVNYKEYMALAGLDAAAIEDCKYAVCYIKLSKTCDARLNITVSGKDGSGKTVTASGDAAHQSDNYIWQYVLVPLFDGESDATVDEITISFLKGAKTGEILYLRSINFFEDNLSAVNFMGLDPYGIIKEKTHEIVVPGISREYTFMHLTDTHLCALNQQDKKEMSASRYKYCFDMRYTYRVYGILSENKLSAFYKLAEERNVDAVIMSGDIITFPSYANIDLLHRIIGQSSVKTAYVVGNHDWTFADKYWQEGSKYLPMLSDLSGGDPHFSYIEYDDVIIAMVDNSTNTVSKETVDKFFALYEKNKPIILSLHVPLYAEGIYQKGIEKEGKSYTMGGKALNGDDPQVKRLYEEVCLNEDTPVIAVLSGHVHFEWQENFPNGVPQYTTLVGFDGGCSFIKLKPQ